MILRLVRDMVEDARQVLRYEATNRCPRWNTIRCRDGGFWAAGGSQPPRARTCAGGIEEIGATGSGVMVDLDRGFRLWDEGCLLLSAAVGGVWQQERRIARSDVPEMEWTTDLVQRMVPYHIYVRGLNYYQSHMVLAVDYDPNQDVWEGKVLGSNGRVYDTALGYRDQDLHSRCSCRYEDTCKHVVALALAAIAHSRPGGAAKTPGHGAKDQGVTVASSSPPTPDPDPSAVVEGSAPSWEERLEPLLQGDLVEDPRVGVHHLVFRLHLIGEGRVQIRTLEARLGKAGLGREQACILPHGSYVRYEHFPTGATPAQKEFLRFLSTMVAGRTSQAVIPAHFLDTCLGILSDFPFVFLGEGQTPLQIGQNPLHASISLTEEEGGLHLRAVIRDGTGNLLPLQDGDWDFLRGHSLWLRQGTDIDPIQTADDPHLLMAVAQHPLVVPAEDVGRFLQRYLPRLAGRTVATLPPSLERRIVSAAARPILTLAEERGRLVLDLAFAYGDGPARPLTDEEGLLEVPVGQEVHYLRRDPAAERAARKRLEDLGLQPGEDGLYRLKGERALDFLWDLLPVLEQETGWEVYGEDSLQAHRLLRRSPKTRATLTSGLDWFDVQIQADYGDSVVDTGELLSALESGRRYVRLGDGQWGRLPPSLQEGLAAELREVTAGASEVAAAAAVRLPRHDVALAAALLDAAEEKTVDPSWEDFHRQIEGFAGIRPSPLPASLEGTLRPYQNRGYDWLHFLREYRLGGILADDMGLGKTIQTLALLLAEHRHGQPSGPSLLVVPTSLVWNWQEEARRFAPGLRILPLVGSQREGLFARMGDCDLVLTTYGLLRRDIEKLALLQFHYLILDEAHAIKNPEAQTARAAKAIPARHRLALTGTPMENHLLELWSLFDFLMPGFLGNRERFEVRYLRPVQSGDSAALGSLRRRVHPFILRRLKQDVLADLPPKTEIVRYCEMPPAQRKLYQQVLATYRAKVLEEVEEKGLKRSRIIVLDALLKLRQVACHPQLLKLPGNRVTAAGKLDLFREVLTEIVAEGHKVLVFSQFVSMLHILQRDLDREGIAYETLTGQTRDRQIPIERFNTRPDIPVFLISLKAGGTGLNLTSASYVIHYDPWWNPAAEAQATDRAHRIGQQKEVFSIKMITRGTVEEKILELQERKRQLVAELFSGESSQGKDLTREDLEELFSLD